MLLDRKKIAASEEGNGYEYFRDMFLSGQKIFNGYEWSVIYTGPVKLVLTGCFDNKLKITENDYRNTSFYLKILTGINWLLTSNQQGECLAISTGKSKILSTEKIISAVSKDSNAVVFEEIYKNENEEEMFVKDKDTKTEDKLNYLVLQIPDVDKLKQNVREQLRDIFAISHYLALLANIEISFKFDCQKLLTEQTVQLTDMLQQRIRVALGFIGEKGKNIETELLLNADKRKELAQQAYKYVKFCIGKIRDLFAISDKVEISFPYKNLGTHANAVIDFVSGDLRDAAIAVNEVCPNYSIDISKVSDSEKILISSHVLRLCRGETPILGSSDFPIDLQPLAQGSLSSRGTRSSKLRGKRTSTEFFKNSRSDSNLLSHLQNQEILRFYIIDPTRFINAKAEQPITIEEKPKVSL